LSYDQVPLAVFLYTRDHHTVATQAVIIVGTMMARFGCRCPWL